jgi:hypothetical protein
MEPFHTNIDFFVAYINVDVIFLSQLLECGDLSLSHLLTRD